ncbi:MAG: glycogen debranching enzyme N-terminal domain-containing protein [Bacteroidales bacterium]|jgi:predicted glycogen debranching enzyme|nr:glycogen debranching enzyme N-terminal domain-containing protein [Bacteroidales bacterium]
MEYLEFTKQEVTNLNLSLKQEFLRTNRAGSYACSTIINCNTRKYHGLLVCPLPDFNNEHFVLLSSLDETVIQHNTPFNLAIHKYTQDFNPLGHKYIESYTNSSTPSVTYRVGGVLLEKQMLLVEEEERVIIKYTLLKAHSKTTLQLRPFLAFRNIHELTHANMHVNSKYQTVQNGIASRLYENFPFLHMQISKKNEFVSAPDWYKNFEYLKEKERGFESVEDLMTPGYFECTIKKGESVYFSAGLSEIKTTKITSLFESELSKRTPRNSYENCLQNAAEQFISRKGNKTDIIASFPWPGKWGRDSLIALPGLTLTYGDTQTCQDVLDTITDEIEGYIYKNIGNIEHANVDSIDTALWYIRAVQQFTPHTTKANIKKRYGKKIEEILEKYRMPDNKTIVMHDNGLLYLNDKNKALTWPDAKINGQPVYERWGYVVEINALWYNAIQFALEIISDKTFTHNWKDIPSKIKESFSTVFWSEERQYLADYVAGNHVEESVRPSQVFAASLPYSPLKNDLQKHAVLEIIKKELLTPRGIRTLSPKNPLYKGECTGNIHERDIAYHHGSVLLWFLAPYAEAYLDLHGRSGLTEIKRMYESLEESLNTHGVGAFSELYDGNPPHEGRGAISQAWSVAAVLRIQTLIKNFEQQKITQKII